MTHVYLHTVISYTHTFPKSPHPHASRTPTHSLRLSKTHPCLHPRQAHAHRLVTSALGLAHVPLGADVYTLNQNSSPGFAWQLQEAGSQSSIAVPRIQEETWGSWRVEIQCHLVVPWRRAGQEEDSSVPQRDAFGLLQVGVSEEGEGWWGTEGALISVDLRTWSAQCSPRHREGCLFPVPESGQRSCPVRASQGQVATRFQTHTLHVPDQEAQRGKEIISRGRRKEWQEGTDVFPGLQSSLNLASDSFSRYKLSSSRNLKKRI